MKSFVCDICGGALAMESNGQNAVCEYCGIKYPKERLQAIVQEIRGTVKVEGSVAVEGIGTKNKLLNNAETYLSLGQYDRAETTYRELTEKYPEEAGGWWGLYKLVAERFREGHKSFTDMLAAEPYAVAAKRLKDVTEEYDQLWDNLLEVYKNKPFTDQQEAGPLKPVTEDALEIMLTTLPKEVSEKAEQLQALVTERYVSLFREGKASFFAYPDTDGYKTQYLWGNEKLKEDKSFHIVNEYPGLKALIDEGRENASRITSGTQYTHISRVKSRVICHGGSSYTDSFGKSIYDFHHGYHGTSHNLNYDLDKLAKIIFHLGRTLVVAEPRGARDYATDTDPRLGFYLLILNRAYTTEEIAAMCDGKWSFKSPSEAHSYTISHSIQEDIAEQKRQRQWEQAKKWRSEGKCPRCGGELKKSFLGKKCSNPSCTYPF